jgi:hypothetical protein
MSENESMQTCIGELTSDCVCDKLDENGDWVVDENNDPVPADECRGDCFQDQLEWWHEVYEDWIERNNMNNATEIEVLFRGVSWESVTGETSLQVEEMKDLEPFRLNGDYRLRYELKETTLMLKRTSHDEMRAEFAFAVTQNYCEDCKHELINKFMKPDWSRTLCLMCKVIRDEKESSNV